MEYRFPKKILLMGLIIIIFVLLVVFSFILLSRNRIIKWEFGDNKYDYLKNYCDYEENEEGYLISCAGLIIDEETSEKKMSRCFILSVKDETGALKDVEICSDKSSITWTNPYADYSKHIPVNLEGVVRKRPLFFSKLDSVVITLLDEEEIIDLIGASDPNDLKRSIYIPEVQKREENGFYLTKTDDSHVNNVFVLSEAEISEYNVENDSIVITLETRIRDKNITIDSEGEKFGFLTLEEGFLEERNINPDNVSSVLEKGKIYQVSFICDPSDFNIEEFINELEESDNTKLSLPEGLKILTIIDI